MAGISVSIGGTNKELKDVLKDSTGALVLTQKQFEQLGQQGGSAFSDLEHSLKSFKREQVQQGRLVGFYVKELTEFTGMGKEASETVSGLGQMLVEGAAGGLSFGLAFEAVKFGVKLVNDELERHKKQLESIEAAQKALDDQRRIGANILRDLVGHESASEKAGREYAEKVAPAILKKQEELNKFIEDGAGWWRKLFFEERSGVFDTYNEQVKALTESLRQMRLEAEGTRNAIMYLAGGGTAGDAGLKQGPAWDKQAAAADAAIRKAQGENDAKARQRDAAAKAAGEKVLGDQSLASAARENMAAAMPLPKTVQPVEYGGEDLAQKANEKFNQAMAKQYKAEEKADQDALKKRVALYSSYGARIGEAFGAAIAQGASPLKALGALLKETLKAIIQTVISSVTAKAADAAAGAAASQASVPIVGPALAAGAMAAMLGLVMGLVSMIPSASGGYDIPGTVNPLVQAHANEMVLPAKYAQGFRNIIENGQTGGGGNIYVSAIDARSFDQYLRRNGKAVVRAIRNESKNRRA